MSFRRHYIRQQGLHTPVVASSAAFFACSTKFAHATNAAKPWQQDFGLAGFLAGYSFSTAALPCLPEKGSTGEATMRVDLSVTYLRIWGGRLHEHIWHLLCVRAHPQFFELELQAPMGACLEQYGS